LQSLKNDFKTLELNPAFQRKSVWEISDRNKFIKTILEGMPCPTIFLFKRWDKKRHDYIQDVIDGKQRLETIFMFCGKLSPYKIQVTPEKKKKLNKWIKNFNYSELSNEQRKNFMDFNIPIGNIELKDESDGADQGISDIIEAFIRINTKGRPLSKQEQRHASFIKKPILELAKDLTKNFNKVFSMSSEQKGRMKDTEITLELLISIAKNEILNKKLAIDRGMGEEIPPKDLRSAKKNFLKVCKIISRLDLGKSTMFIRKTPDFYSLFYAIMELERAGFIFKDYDTARKKLSVFSSKIAQIATAQQSKNFSYLQREADTPFYKYWSTTQRSSDSKEYRKIRSDIIREILIRTLKTKKDENRFFNVHQKEQVWEKSRQKKCSYPGCEKVLIWQNATIDHKIPWSLGGPTDVSNAQLMCKQHNSMKRDKEFTRYFISQK
jgi:5-methylcytosine-specific restriction endonuclease McrA